MKIRCLLVLSAFLVCAACTDDTAGGVAGAPTFDSGNNDNNSMPDMSGPEDMGDALGALGDACEFGSDCESGICINGECSLGCSGDEDCPAGSSCVEIEVDLEDGGTETVSACIEDTPCTANSDCSGPNVCVADRTGDEIDLTCDDPAGPGDVGSGCTADTDCESGLCIDGECSAPCDAASDCGNAAFVCEITSVDTDTGGSDDLPICVPRPADVCLSDNECSGTDRCVATKSMTNITFECGDAVGTGESGDMCTTDADCAQNLCINGMCAGPCAEVGDCGGDPNRCEVTNVDLGNGAMDSAQICQPPIPCASQNDCPVAGGDVCYVREDMGAIDPICRDPNAGGGGLGQVCNDDAQCANNLCLGTRFRDVCVIPCADDADCGVAGYECGTVAVDLTSGGTEDVGACVPEAPTPCTAESDCGSGFDCAIIDNVAGDALESVCVPTTGGEATGVPCTVDDDCASLVCQDNFCAAPCTDTTQCGNEQLCLNQTVTKTPNSGDFDICVTLPVTQCTSTDDCTDGVRVCGDVQGNAMSGLDEAFCNFPNVGAQQLGTACTVSTDCRETICLNNISSECSVVCDKDTDCAAGGACTTFGNLNFCNTACSDNTDCGAPNRYCAINSDVLTDSVDQICVNPIGASDIGTVCTSGSECLTGLCLRTVTYNNTSCNVDNDCAAFPNHTCECPINQPNCTTGRECATTNRRCTNLCDDDGDCGNGLTDCSPNIFVGTPSGGTQNISACSQP